MQKENRSGEVTKSRFMKQIHALLPELFTLSQVLAANTHYYLNSSFCLKYSWQTLDDYTWGMEMDTLLTLGKNM